MLATTASQTDRMTSTPQMQYQTLARYPLPNPDSPASYIPPDSPRSHRTDNNDPDYFVSDDLESSYDERLVFYYFTWTNN